MALIQCFECASNPASKKWLAVGGEDMALQLDGLEPLRTMAKTLEAESYNRVRVVLARLGKPLQFELPDFRGLEIILDDDSWICIDTFGENRPVLAWSEFETKGRDNINAPVPCKLHLYHHQSGLIMGSALEALDKLMIEQLDALRHNT